MTVGESSILSRGLNTAGWIQAAGLSGSTKLNRFSFPYFQHMVCARGMFGIG